MLWNFKSNNSLQDEDKARKENSSALFTAAKNSIVVQINITISWFLTLESWFKSQSVQWISLSLRGRKPEVVRKISF